MVILYLLAILLQSAGITWLYNGNMHGISGNNYFANTAGVYNIVESNLCGSDTSAAVILTADSLPIAVITAWGLCHSVQEEMLCLRHHQVIITPGNGI